MKKLKHKLIIWLVIPIILIGSDVAIALYSFYIGSAGIEWGLFLAVAVALGIALVIEITIDDILKNST